MGWIQDDGKQIVFVKNGKNKKINGDSNF